MALKKLLKQTFGNLKSLPCWHELSFYFLGSSFLGTICRDHKYVFNINTKESGMKDSECKFSLISFVCCPCCECEDPKGPPCHGSPLAVCSAGIYISVMYCILVRMKC
jgi:hypothetical protein